MSLGEQCLVVKPPRTLTVQPDTYSGLQPERVTESRGP